MNAIRCFHCGLINWEIGEKCQHCGLSLPTEESFDFSQYEQALDNSHAAAVLRPAYAEHPERSAGLWFAGAGAIPAVLFVLFVDGGLTNFFSGVGLLFIAAPVIIAGICGRCFGASILDPNRVRSLGQAAWRGFVVAAMSFLFYTLFFSIICGAPGLFLLVIIYGAIIIGWLVAIVGAVAGMLLYQRRSRVN